MIPTQYVETVAVADVTPYLEESCVSYCDLEAENRCKTGVEIGPGLAPSSYRDSIIVYVGSTRKKYISRVEYTTKMKPKSYSETNYMRPKAVCRTFASMVDYHAEGNRKWYKTMVQLEPKSYSSSHEVTFEGNRKKSDVSDTNDVTLDSMGYISDENSLGDPLSPLRLQEGQRSPLEDFNTPWSHDNSPRSRREERTEGKVDYHRGKSRDSGYGASEVYESHWDSDMVTTHRSGPFIYNAPKERRRRYFDDLEDESDTFPQKQMMKRGDDKEQRRRFFDDLVDENDTFPQKQMMNGEILNGLQHRNDHYREESPKINGYSHIHSDLDDLVDL